MKLWIDDIRKPPDDTWIWAKSSRDAIEYIYCGGVGYFDLISFDHDLGGNDTSRTVVLFLCNHPDLWPNKCLVHSANPVGKEWLEEMIKRYNPGV